MRRRRGAPASVLALVVLLAAAVVAWSLSTWGPGRADARPAAARAADVVPAGTAAWSFTDWGRVRATVDPDGRQEDLARFLLDADVRDLATRSVLDASAEGLQRLLGWSLPDLAWESFALTDVGEVLVLRPRFSEARLRASLREAGYSRSGDTWTVSGSVLRGAQVTDLLQRVELPPGSGVLVAGTRAAAVRGAVQAVEGRAPSLLSDASARDVVAALGRVTGAVLESAAVACPATAVGADEQGAAGTALARVGPLARYRWLGRGVGVDGRRTVASIALGFPDPRTAQRQVVTRSELAAGPVIGASEVLAALDLTSRSTDGGTALLRFDYDPSDGSFLQPAAPFLASCPS